MSTHLPVPRVGGGQEKKYCGEVKAENIIKQYNIISKRKLSNNMNVDGLSEIRTILNILLDQRLCDVHLV